MGASVRTRLGTAGTAASFVLLLLVGVAGTNAARPGLGPRGWAPGDLGWHLTSAVVTGLLWAAYVVGAFGVLGRLREAGRGPGTAVAVGRAAAFLREWRVPLLLGVAALLTAPFGSADHTNYAAYGRIAAGGGDPYLTPPDQWAAGDPVTSRVEPPWTHTVSIYGPFATALQALTSLVGGDNLRQTVWAWQVLVVVAWLAVRLLLRRAGADRQRVDTLWTLNPLVFGIGVLGAHVDLVAGALVLAALVVASRSPVVAGLVGGLAVSTKVTCGVAGVALLLAWWVHERGSFVRRTVQVVVAALLVAVPLHVWAGPHVFDQLDRARRSISLATPWRLLFEWLAGGPLAASTARTVITALSVVLAVGLVVVLTRLTRDSAALAVTAPGQAHLVTTVAAARWLVVLSAAYTLAAPYSLPWYDLLTWVALPLLAPGVLDVALLVRLATMGVAYVPGRVVGMTPSVERLTLGVRRRVAPWLVLGVWGWLSLAASRGWSRRREPRPPAP
ncbi:hypothetical protein [Pedococcus sp. 2YAF34]|uniref:hypothetical protein n=1 Tax=Pedococcus sp. 2YAF34 TaxID=3233032 RepID=UPI003F9E5C51